MNRATCSATAAATGCLAKGGDDILIFDNADQVLHGGEGFDTLRLAAGSGQVSLQGSPNIVSIEAIDIATIGCTLRFTAEDVCRISDNDALVITSVPSDTFNSFNMVDPGTGWQFDGYSDNGRFLQFSQSGAHLSVENTIKLIGLDDILP